MSEIVMVGVDGSNTAFKAASRAADIAEGLNAELAVLTAHVKENTEVIKIGNDTWILDDAKQAQKMAERVAAKLREEHPDLIIRPVAVRGKPQEALVEEAARVGAGLLVVGNVGLKGLGRVLGSVANSVARNAPCDVLIVRTDR
ncbi:universal stress protein [Arthrobacter sulfonylureivorans]|uniref:Universal stress protein n=1 Tax=Arthrobacter sulfonylureivorans TaxID=2486855 RepID=A0ABY3W323_9MICC|nr:universal stress protein [Arthrobacter sulfonylureivorans]UNK44487.1 universal stress protein [Arthrobacter sulfonylureivorans]